jgi:pimeloyl-ACP methyl ester carboxylesterase
MPDMARYHYPMFPSGLVLKHRFESEQKLPSLRVPHLLGHGRRDTLIPFRHADRLAAVSKSAQLTRYVSDEAGHNDFFDVADRELAAVLRQWLRQF